MTSKDRELLKLAQAALEDMYGGWKYIRSYHGDLYGVAWDRAQGKAEAALAAIDAHLSETAEPADMRAVCEALGFDPTNHHNAAKCPYCRPQPAEPAKEAPACALTESQVADCVTAIKPYPMELVTVPAEQVVAFARNIEAAIRPPADRKALAEEAKMRCNLLRAAAERSGIRKNPGAYAAMLGTEIEAHAAIDRLAATPAQAVPSGWQPIAMAPKDGRRVLVWNKGCEHWVASWRLPVRGEPQCESYYVHEWRDGGGRWATPTHWMPLPATPSHPEQGDAA